MGVNPTTEQKCGRLPFRSSFSAWLVEGRMSRTRTNAGGRTYLSSVVPLGLSPVAGKVVQNPTMVLCNAFASNVCIWVLCTSFVALRCARQCATPLVRLSVSLQGSVPCQYFWSARSNSFVRGCYLHYLCGCSTCCFNPVLVHVQASKPALVTSRSTSPQWFAVPSWSHLVLLPLSATRRSSSVGCSSNHLTSG